MSSIEPVGPPQVGPQATPSVDRAPVDLTTSRQLARLMDDLVTLPGTKVGLGADALIGLIPGVGDLAGSAFSSVIVYDAIRCRVPVPTLARMGWNLVLDAGLGLVPFGGDLLDVAHRANRKNYLLLERAVAKNPYPEAPSVGYVLAAIGLVVVPMVLALVVGLVALWLLIRWIAG